MIRWLKTHPSTIRQIAQLFFQGNYKAAEHCLVRLRRQGKVRVVAKVQLSPEGRPTDVYGFFSVGKPMHEYLVTRFCTLFPDAKFLRGSKVDQKKRPDAEMTLERTFDIEVFTGSQRENQIRGRWKAYQGCERPLLIVVYDVDDPDESVALVRELMGWGKMVDQIAFYITLTEVEKDPLGAVWVDGGGHGTTLGKILGTNHEKNMA